MTLNARPIPYLRVSGTAYEMGLQHGQHFADKIRTIWNRSVDWIERSTELFKRQLLQRVQHYIPYVQASTPWLSDEVRGIADGSGISFEEAFAMQARFELIYTPGAECTVLGVASERTESARALIAQNIDLPAENEENIIILDLVLNDGRPAILTVTIAGILSQEGLNSAGLAVCGSLVVSRDWGVGYPNRNFLRRYILEQPDVPSALVALDHVGQRAASHYIALADASGTLVSLEQTPHKFRVLKPDDGTIAHTNHYQHSDLVSLEGLSISNPSLYKNSVVHYSRMKSLLAGHQGRFGLETLQGFLADHEDEHSICTHSGRESKTVVFVAAEPASHTLYVGLGNPCQSHFNAYQLGEMGSSPAKGSEEELIMRHQ